MRTQTVIWRTAILFVILLTGDYAYGQWDTSGSNIYNKNSGGVGIGIQNPGSYKLYLNGTQYVNGAATFAGTTTISNGLVTIGTDAGAGTRIVKFWQGDGFANQGSIEYGSSGFVFKRNTDTHFTLSTLGAATFAGNMNVNGGNVGSTTTINFYPVSAGSPTLQLQAALTLVNTSTTFGSSVNFPAGDYHNLSGVRFFSESGSSEHQLFTNSGGLLIRNVADNATLVTIQNSGAATFAGTGVFNGGQVGVYAATYTPSIFQYDNNTGSAHGVWQTSALNRSTSPGGSDKAYAYWKLNYSDTGDLLVVNGLGNVGIGTIDPTAKLDVSGATHSTWGTVKIKGTDGNGVIFLAGGATNQGYISLDYS